MPEWAINTAIFMAFLTGPAMLHALCRLAGAPRRGAGISAVTLWGSVYGFALSVSVRADEEYRLPLVVIGIGSALLSALLLAAAMMVSKFRETGEL